MAKKDEAIKKILLEDDRRMEEFHAPFNPVTGVGSIGQRFLLHLPDFPIVTQMLPMRMQSIPLIRQLQNAGSIDAFYKERYGDGGDFTNDRLKIIEQITRMRCRYDFPFWAATYIRIKTKGGGDDMRFVLNRPQRKLISVLERQREANKPIRIILLKARQWGGSTAIQLYMFWLQVMHRMGLNSLIIAHQGSGSDEVKQMFERALAAYPVRLLHRLGEQYSDNEKKLIGVGHSGAISKIPQRNCTIKIGTAERPDSSRTGDYSCIHFSETAYWKKTEGKSPQDIVRSASAGVVYRPYTFIAYESTANGTGNFFHTEYTAAKSGYSMFEALFIAWHEIEIYTIPFHSQKERKIFATSLYDNRLNDNRLNGRHATGKYLWWLWTKGATLESIHWYVTERTGYDADEQMQSEYPTDDVEAFVHSGARVFDKYAVEELRPSCQPPQLIGDVIGKDTKGKGALTNLHFVQDKQGLLWIWDPPDIDAEERVLHRYLVVVDIGGRSRRADWSVIVVFDRLFMMDGDKPMVVAQWYGHIDMDLLAWKAAQIAAFYDNALLVIESNTLETRDPDRDVDGDHSASILDQIKDSYDNLYAREQTPEAIAEGKPRLYGFHTNKVTKPLIIDTLIETIRENLYIERDERCLDEYLTYEQKQDGSYGAISGKHDDLLMTRAIGLYICFRRMDLPRIIKIPKQQSSRPPATHRRAISAATI